LKEPFEERASKNGKFLKKLIPQGVLRNPRGNNLLKEVGLVKKELKGKGRIKNSRKENSQENLGKGVSWDFLFPT